VKQKKPKKISRGGQAVRISKRVAVKDGKEYPSWQIFWREAGKARSTSRATEEGANTLADEIATKLAKGEIRQRILTGIELHEYEQAIDLCRHAGSSILDAAKLLKATNRPPQSKLVKDVRDEFLLSKQRRSFRHRDSLKNDTKYFSDHFGERPMMEVHVGDLSKWLVAMPVAPRTKRNRFTNVRTMFRWARQNGYLPDTVTEIERVDEAIWADESRENWEDDEHLDDVRLLTPVQLKKLFAAIPSRLVPTLALSAFQGVRRSEALRLHWTMIKKDHIEVPRMIARKQNRRRVPPYLDTCKAWLESHRQAEGLIIPSPDRFTQLTAIARKIGIDPWPSNVLRHSFISYRLVMTKNAPQTALEAGTSVQKIESNYDEKATEKDAKAWFAVMPPKKSRSACR
jgi:integrase